MAHPLLSYPVVAFMMIWWLFRGVAGAAPPNPDPLQSSAEFGAAEATAKITTKAGFLDIVGIKLGMPGQRGGGRAAGTQMPRSRLR